MLTTCFAAMAHTTGEKIEQVLQARYGDIANSPGAAVIIAKGDSIIHESYRGVADFSTGERISPITRFNIASVSKQFTVIAMLQQVEVGRIKLSDRLTEYFPEYKRPFWAQITPADLAGHTSGLPDSRDRSDRDAIVHATDESSAKYFSTIKELKFKPGTAYDYINPTFILIARIIEQVTGEEFCKYAMKNVLGKAEMYNSYYFDPNDRPKHQSHGYILKGAVWIEYDYGEETFFATRPDGGIYSTARDMLRWEKALRNNTVISPELLAIAYSKRIDVSSSPWCDYQRRPATYYGLGWFIDSLPGRPTKVYHTGDNGGYQAYVAKYPGTDISVIVLENRNDCDRWTLATTIEDILIEDGYIKP